MTDQERDKLLLEVLAASRENTARLERVHAHTEALKTTVGNLHDDMLLVKQRRDDHTQKFVTVDAALTGLGERMKAMELKQAERHGAGLIIKGGWAVIVVIAGGLISLASLAVAFYRR